MNLGKGILFLSERDVDSLLTMREALSAVERVFALHGVGQVQMPPKIYLTFDPHGGDLRAMPAYVKGDATAAGVKIVNSTPGNPARGLPAVSGIMVLNDPETGLPLAVMAAGTLTGIRTGAGGGIAAKYLARKDARVIGLVGCGKQAQTQLEALSHFFTFERVLVWGQTVEEARGFCNRNRGAFEGEFEAHETVEAVCACDILVTTTPVRKPLVEARWIRPGTHINAIGADAPGKQELDHRILSAARVVVDDVHQASHAGEINVAVSEKKFSASGIAAQLGEVVAGKKPGRRSDQDITIFDSTGLAIQDVAVGRVVYEKALNLKKGTLLNFHG